MKNPRALAALVQAASPILGGGPRSVVLHVGDRQHHGQAWQLVLAQPTAASNINTMRSEEEDHGNCHKIAKRILLHSTQVGQFLRIHKTTHYHKIRAYKYCFVTLWPCDLPLPNPSLVWTGLDRTCLVLCFPLSLFIIFILIFILQYLSLYLSLYLCLSISTSVSLYLCL